MHTEVENRQPGKISLWKAVFFTTILLLVATSVVAKGPKPATVDMQDAQGKSIGTATLSSAAQGGKDQTQFAGAASGRACNPRASKCHLRDAGLQVRRSAL